MVTEFSVLSPGMTVAECLEILVENRMFSMPVVDAAGKYLGHFRKNIVLSHVLPQIAVKEGHFESFARMINAGLLSDTMGDVRERFALIANDPVSLHMDKEAPILRPEQALVSALFYMFHGRNFLPVVESGTDLLVGVISAWDVLESIAGKP